MKGIRVKRKSLANVRCPIAQTLERVGDQWSILILRDAIKGAKRFDDFQRSLEIAPNTLTCRLNDLVDHGFLVRQRYSEHPPRDEYLLTERGKDFQSVVQAFVGFGNRNFREDSGHVVFIDTNTGHEADPITVDRHSGEIIRAPRFEFQSAEQQA
ncbi:helix-turn-helix domain-containing protein [Rhizobium sp. BE258]|uniref:winged helix-turn-helix transcriptional regulator n=1 Tax=Rhizobium sp. BE258 TaxID=2817722 RepID=UPI00286AEAB6|nr:helix-turn-helix domain-containing protein [Rhizobium sp. BE258]